MALGVVLTAGGSGARFGGPIPKQFLEIRPGRPLLRYALETLHDLSGVEAVALVLPPDRLEDWRYLTEIFTKLKLVAGGPERWISVRHGVEALPGSVDVVLIHDAARPFTPRSVIRQCLEAAKDGEAAITAFPASDTVKEVSGGKVTRTLDRTRLVLVQTPQVFPRAMLAAMYAKGLPAGLAPTDEAQIAELAGFTVNWVKGSLLSRKITSPDDWEWAESTVECIDKKVLALND